MAAPLSFAAENCKRGEYYFNAYKNSGNLPASDAVAMLERAVEACSRWEYWQKLGETTAKVGDRSLTAKIAEAYVSAYEVAGSDAERALSAGRYGELLLNTGDPQNALKYVHHARNLTPGDPWLDELATRVNQQVAEVDVSDIKRGLGDMAFKRLRLQRSVPADDFAAIGGTGGAGGGASPAPTSPDQALRKSINVPLTFEINSTALDAATQNNLAVLAETLAQDEYGDKQFLLVGHADVRGDAAANQVLSARRATAIFEAIKSLQPRLSNRITTTGKGEEQPLSTGMTESDHRINRRLEVVLLE
jgi:outer membrane protein OmpA-like peptidoglycan-associated protein